MKILRTLGCIASSLLVSTLASHAHPYASGCTNVSGTVKFFLNETPDRAWVIFDDGSSNSLSNPKLGTNSFVLTGHNSYSIYVVKIGTGVPKQYSIDTNQWNLFNSPRGVAVNLNPRNGTDFGRIYVANSATGSQTVNPPNVTYRKGKGLYMLNSDFSVSAKGNGTNALTTGVWTSGSTSSPYRICFGQDGNLYVGDYATATGNVWKFGPSIESTNQMLAVTGATAGAAAGIHGDYFGEPVQTGSLAGGNYTLWLPDSVLQVNGGTLGGSTVLGYNTANGNYNNVYKYAIGSGPIPATGWSNAPSEAMNLGLSGLGPDIIVIDVDVGRVTGNVYGMHYRLNYGAPVVQIFDPTGANLLWDSLTADGGSLNTAPDFFNPTLTTFNNSDPFGNGTGTQSSTGPGTVAGYTIHVSPDERFMAIAIIQNTIMFMSLVNGIPDPSTLTTILNPPNDPATHGNVRGITFDAADNVYTVSSGQGYLRAINLGLSTTCVTTNDATSTNGAFFLQLPPISASVTATTPVGSQGHGSPTPVVFTITLTTNVLTQPLLVNFAMTGTAANGTNYTLDTLNATNILIPAQTNAGNITYLVHATPTATPVVGPTLSLTLTINGGSAVYVPKSPSIATGFIANTGPETFTVTASSATSMYRGTTNDYATFVITRTGDTNAPTLTLTNFVYGGTAVFGTDYKAGAQNVPTTAGANLLNGNMGIAFNPGDVTHTVAVGAPVPTPYGSPSVGNKTITVQFGATNGTSQENTSYTATTNIQTLTIFDNSTKPEVVLWSDALTSASDSTNWTLTFASTNLGATTVLPRLIPNYPNNYSQANPDGSANNDNGGTNDFDVEFGYPLSADGIGQSPDMVANGWTTALKMTVNKDYNVNGSSAGVNVFPQGKKFYGNYALRFSMKLNEGSYFPYEYAMFGINHQGVNCDWVGSDLVTARGSGYTNQDGVWGIVAAGAGGPSGGFPPDYFLATSDIFPNGSYTSTGAWDERTSSFGTSFANQFKHPVVYDATGSGTPADQSGVGKPLNSWSDVEVNQVYTNNGTALAVTFYINKTKIQNTFVNTNFTNLWTNGNIMLGYDDAVADEGAGSGAAVYFSDVRVVELSPAITNVPASLTVTVGASVNWTLGAVGVGPFTNTWLKGTNVIKTDVFSSDPNNDSDSYSIGASAPSDAGSYSVVVSDAAGSSTNTFTLTVNSPLVITSAPTNITTYVGGNAAFTVVVTGTGPTYQWSSNATALVNGGNVSGATNATLSLTNVIVADTATYSVLVSNVLGTTNASATLTVLPAPPSLITNLVTTSNGVSLSFYSGDPFDTTNSFNLQGSTNLANPVNYGFTNITPAPAITLSGTNFTATIPTNGIVTNKFFRVQHK